VPEKNSEQTKNHSLIGKMKYFFRYLGVLWETILRRKLNRKEKTLCTLVAKTIRSALILKSRVQFGGFQNCQRFNGARRECQQISFW
jgi:hypothetical protein